MEILTIDEVAKLIKVKRSTLYSWVSEGSIPSFKANGLIRFDKEEVLNWLRSSRITKKAGPKDTAKKQNQDINSIIKRAINSEK